MVSNGLENVESGVARDVAKRIERYESQGPLDDEKRVWWVDSLKVHSGNNIESLIDGKRYFGELLATIETASRRIYATGWAIGPKFPLSRAEDKEADQNGLKVRIGEAIGLAAQKKVDARILVWLNLFALADFDASHHRALFGEKSVVIREMNGTVLHQKTLIVDGVTAFCGGIDITKLGGDHWDTPAHTNKPGKGKEPLERYRATGRHEAKYWHDVQVKITGPAVGAIEQNFAERWADVPRINDNLPPPEVDSKSGGSGGHCSLQVIRTVPPAASTPVETPLDGTTSSADVWSGIAVPAQAGPQPRRREEYSVLEFYGRAIINATKFIYIENQYFTCKYLIDLLKRRLSNVKDLSVVVLMPKESEISYPGEDLKYRFRTSFSRGVAKEPVVTSTVVREIRALAAERVFFACPVNEIGEDIYVHAKVMVVDDQYATVGSANFSQRSMFYDFELGVAWRDDEGSGVRDFRRNLWGEHLGLKKDELAELEKGAANKTIAAIWKERAADSSWKRRIQEWMAPR